MAAAATASLTQDLISKLRYRKLLSELESRNLSAEGTTAQLRSRLAQAVAEEERLRSGGAADDDDECVVYEDGTEDCEPVRVARAAVVHSTTFCFLSDVLQGIFAFMLSLTCLIRSCFTNFASCSP